MHQSQFSTYVSSSPFSSYPAFRALLQIRAMRKKLGPLSPTSFNPIISSQTSDSEEHSVSAQESFGCPTGVGWEVLGLEMGGGARVFKCKLGNASKNAG